jgi:large subunit ribosomal protein L3
MAKKLGITQIFDQDGGLVPVTVVQAGPCAVVQRKTSERDGYAAVQLGFGEARKKRLNKPLEGHFARAKAAPQRHLREFPLAEDEEIQEGQVLGADLFAPGDYVDVTGTSKGRGFAGVMKRHGFSGASATHGTHESFRGPGSIGSSADPARVFKGLKMAGHMGSRRVTVENLLVIRVVKQQNILLIRGAVPGANGGLLLISRSKKKTSRGTSSGED